MIFFPSNFSAYPTFLELTVECTYPIDQSMSTALIYFSSSVQSVALMAVEPILRNPLSESEMKKQTCAPTGDTSHEQAKDYLPYTIFLTVYVGIFIILYCIFFNPEMKRSNADKMQATSCSGEGDCLASTTADRLENRQCMSSGTRATSSQEK